MLTDDDYELLVHLDAGELTPDTVASLEARLTSEPELRRAQQQLRSLERVSKQLPTSSDETEKLAALVDAAMHAQPRRERRWLALAAVVALLVVAAALVRAFDRTTITVLSETVTVNGRTVVAGDSVRDPNHVTTAELGTAVIRTRVEQRVALAPQTELHLIDGSFELATGALIAQGQDVRVLVGSTRLVISGQAVVSTELLRDAFRVRPDPTPEDLMNLKHVGAIAVVSGAVALYVLQGAVLVEAGGETTTVRAPGRWFGAGSTFVGGAGTSPERPAVSDAGSDEQLAQNGVLEVLVTAAGHPVANASVKLYPRGAWDSATGKQPWRAPLTGTTSGTGVASIAAGPGSYLIAVRVAGFPTTLKEAQRPLGEVVTRTEVLLLPGTRVSGVTENARGHRPVTPATVTAALRSGPEAETRTVDADELGRFAFDDLPPGRWDLEGQAPGVGTASLSITTPATDPLKLVFHASGFVDGFVQFPDGGAAVGARVFVVGDDTIVTDTSATGSFSVEVPPGVRTVQARLDSLVGRAGREVIVHSAETTSAATIVLQRAASLSGRVTSADAGVAGAVVKVTSHSGTGELASADCDVSGRYSVSLVPGLYDVVADADGHARDEVTGVHVAGDTRLDLSLPRNGSLRGTVVDANGTRLSGVSVEIRANWRMTPRTATTSDGRFEFPDVSPGRWNVSSRRADSVLGVWAFATVESGQEAEVQLVLQPTTKVEITTTWKCAGAPSFADLYVFSELRRPASAPPRLRFEPGAPLAISLEPDTYSFSAHSEDGKCSGEVARVVLEAGKTTPVAFELRPRKRALEVLVREPDGHPSARASVSYLDPTNSSLLLAVDDTDADGVCSSYSPTRDVLVVATNGARLSRPVKVSPTTRSVEVTLADAASVELQLEGMVEGTRAQVDLIAVPFSFRDKVITTSPTVSTTVSPGRVHLTAHNEGREGFAELNTKPGEHAHVTIRLEQTGTVRGRLVTPAGKPRSGWLGLLTPTGEERADAVAVDETGTFELRALPGKYLLAAMGENVTLPVTVKGGEATDIGDFRVDPPHQE